MTTPLTVFAIPLTFRLTPRSNDLPVPGQGVPLDFKSTGYGTSLSPITDFELS